MNNQDHEPKTNTVLGKRPTLLSNETYRGFSIDNISKNWNGVKVTAINSKGMKISGNADSKQQAVEKVINQIDLLFDQ
ncbi:hypothetical protein [Fodinibius halophilus]|uniref:Uncharacterized protein n=1 Tax=Fodinibius halophilus TaxID=1736908 RepID=A0A6M1T6S9_9BACT|nr:hypothetical protein [Fodinibius halophilus]NGP89877.1 hypothetical protein [Fodinibius halophilus]